MVIVNIHLENFEERYLKVVERFANRGPIAISITPSQIEGIGKNKLERIRRILVKEGYVLGQQGLNHKCEECEVSGYDFDQWHENYCLWFGEVSVKEQESLMRQGRENLAEVFGIEPELYIPPNHSFGITTVKVAARLGYKWLADNAGIALSPYRMFGVIIVPESYPNVNGSQQIYFHDDQFKRFQADLERLTLQGFESFHDLKPRGINRGLVQENRKLKVVHKLTRDLQKFGLSEDKAGRLAEILYETKFVGDPIV